MWRQGTGKAKNPAAQFMVFVCSKGKKKGNCMKNSIFQLSISWAVPAEQVCCVSTLSCQLCTAQPIPKDCAHDPNKFPAEAPRQEHTEGLPQSTAQNCPPLPYKGRLWAGAPL